jgi:hypothetical protein
MAFQSAADVSGKWSGTIKPEGKAARGVLVIIKQSEGAITGGAGPDENQQWEITDGKVDGNRLILTVTSPDGVYKFILTLDGDLIRGDVEGRSGDQVIKGTLEVTRVKS